MSSITGLPQIFSRILFWNYPRGSWQYDLACALILTFIFLTPKSVFDGSLFSEWKQPRQIEEMKGRADQISPTRQLAEWLGRIRSC